MTPIDWFGAGFFTVLGVIAAAFLSMMLFLMLAALTKR